MTELDLDLVRSVGRAPKQVSCEIVRQLNAADIALLEIERGIKAPTLKRLRDSHHSVARCIAQGLSGADISMVTGYSQSRISILKADPSFQELISHYKSNLEEIKDQVFAGGQEKLAALRDDVIEELHDRLQDQPETLDNGTLLDTLKVTADRSGLGPSSKSTNLNVNIDLAERIAAGRQRVARLGTGALPHPPVLEGEAKPLASLAIDSPSEDSK